jgi:hypothetical protein
MIKTILISTAVLAFAAAGSASAEQAIKVSLNGKTEAVIKAELADAAKSVCNSVLAYPEYETCVQDSYQKAIDRFEKLKAAKLATLVF